MWNKVKALSGKYVPPRIPRLETDNGGFTVDAPEAVESLSQHFETVSRDSSYEPEFLAIKRRAEATPLVFLTRDEESYNLPFTYKELERAIARGKKKAPGRDRVMYPMIQQLPDFATHKLLELLNNIWERGIYPTAWKEAIIVAVPKDGKDPSKPANYRPISLTSVLSKILESMVNYRLSWYLESNRLFDPAQSGFRRYHSTTDQVVALTNHVESAFR